MTTMDKVNAIKAKFEAYNTIVLTKDEELTILSTLDEYQGCGTSRAVWTWEDKYVVKVGLGEAGRVQNEVEHCFYEEHCETDLFAHLYATGTYINVMEALVDLEDCDEDTMIEVVEDLNWVTEYDGGDNEQIGFSEKRNRWVAYDYGYDSEHDHCELVGRMDEWNYLDIPGLAIEGIEKNIMWSDGELDTINLRNRCEDYDLIPLAEVEQVYGTNPYDGYPACRNWSLYEKDKRYRDWDYSNRWVIYYEDIDKFDDQWGCLYDAVTELENVAKRGETAYLIDTRS